MQTANIAVTGAILLASASAYAQFAPTEPRPAVPDVAPAGAPAPDANKPGQAKITVAGYLGRLGVTAWF